MGMAAPHGVVMCYPSGPLVELLSGNGRAGSEYWLSVKMS